MSWRSIFLLSVGLAMDSMAAAATQGLKAENVRARHVVLVALLFGGCQAFMPLLGWLVGARFGPSVEAWDHWVAFVLLGAIGAKMLWEAWGPDEGASETADGNERAALEPKVLMVLAVATSIDALAAGIALPVLGAPLLPSLLTIGLTTGILSALGLLAGRRYGAFLGKRLDALGGVLLIGLGTKILVEHLGVVAPLP